MMRSDTAFADLVSVRASVGASPLSWLTRVSMAFVALLAVTQLSTISSASAAGPVLTVTITHAPAIFQRGDTGDSYTLVVANVGDAPTSGTITLSGGFSPGVKVRSVSGAFNCPTDPELIAGAPLICTTADPIDPGGTLSLGQLVTTALDAPELVTNTVNVSGGTAPDATFTDTTAPVNRAVFDVLNFTARALDGAGNDFTDAGGHPERGTTAFAFPTYPVGVGGGGNYPVEDVKDIFVELPPGFVGNVAAAPRCKLTDLQPQIPTCPAQSKVGELDLGLFGLSVVTQPLYNMVPEKGYPAEFGFKVFDKAVATYVKVRPRTGQYGVTVVVPGAGRLRITSIAVRLDGVPSASNGSGGPPVPFLTNPTDCLLAQPMSRIVVDSWQHPGPLLADGAADLSDGRWVPRTSPAPPLTGCDAPALSSQFSPTLALRPTPETGTSQADAPSGYNVDLTFPQTNDSTDLATVFDPTLPAAPALKDAVVGLPEGVAISPSAADGLDGCSDLPGPGDQVHYDTTVPVSCPNASKIGTVVATTPLLPSRDVETDAITGAQPISGDVYVLKPHPGDLSPTGEGDGKFRALIQVESERDGINAKVPGVVTADRSTGQLTARFEENPQLPIKHLALTFFGGDRAALVNPPTCVLEAKTTGAFTPWSRSGIRSDGVAVAGTADRTSSSVFGVTWDGKGAGCPTRLPFAPQVKTGLLDAQAGASSPLTFDLTREDRQDVINGINVTLPGGLLAAVKDVPLCTDADANAGTCPAGSRVGSASVAAGSGAEPFYLTGQPVSLTGPYKGAPYGLAIAVHAVAGPFDLGTVVVRQALQLDPNDAHATVLSDPLPTIRDGVPLRVRRIHVTIDRPGFMRSPTSCEAKTIDTEVSSLGSQTASLSTPLQVTNCAKLPFAPKLAMKLTGRSETKVGGHPGVEALVTQRLGEAGVKALTVTLPLSLALDPDNAASDSLCEYTDGLKDQCPEKSVIGTMTAISPLLKAPLNGKVYFVKGVRTDPKSGRQIKTLPTLLVELRGEVNINLRATNSVPDNQHLTTTFPNIPDAPLSSAFLKLNGGKKGVLVVTDGHDDICYTPQRPFLAAIGQNGKRLNTATTLTPECPLAVVSTAYTPNTIKVRVSGIGAGTVTLTGPGLKTSRRTIVATTNATVIAKLTATGKRLRKLRRDVRIKVLFVPKGSKRAQTITSPRLKSNR
jgi:hypothetical protein